MSAVMSCESTLQWFIEHDALANENCWSTSSYDQSSFSEFVILPNSAYVVVDVN